MSEIIKYKLTFKETQIRLNDDEVTFTIGQIKSRTMSVAYFKFYGYNLRKQLIAEYTNERWVITSEYSLKTKTFNIPFTSSEYSAEDIDSCVIELYLIGIDSENPLYFNKVQLNSGGYKEYNIPNNSINNVAVGFYNNKYVNLYDSEDNFLQVIRPIGEGFTTEELTTSQTTILAPHLPNETSFDSPTALFYEYMYMTEQEIGVEK